MPPLSMVSSLLGIIKSGSITLENPSPLQVGHIPKGLLKENILGVNSSIDILQSVQESFWLNVILSFPITSIITRPSDILNAISSDSANLPSIPSFIAILSTTTSIVCTLFFSNLISSEIS